MARCEAQCLVLSTTGSTGAHREQSLRRSRMGGNDFWSDMVVHRMSATGKWAKRPLSVVPKSNQWARYDLVVKAAGRARLFIRMVAFPLVRAYDGP